MPTDGTLASAETLTLTEDDLSVEAVAVSLPRRVSFRNLRLKYF